MKPNQMYKLDCVYLLFAANRDFYQQSHINAARRFELQNFAVI